MTLFCSLGSDEVFQVLRQLSSRPRSKDWLDALPNDSLNLLVEDRGPFAHLATDVLNSIAVRETRSSMPKYLGIPIDPSLGSRVVRRFGRSLKNGRIEEGAYLAESREGNISNPSTQNYIDSVRISSVLVSIPMFLQLLGSTLLPNSGLRRGSSASVGVFPGIKFLHYELRSSLS